jgi:hypothetical protein
VHGFEIYTAVLDHGVRSIEGWKTHRRSL